MASGETTDIAQLIDEMNDLEMDSGKRNDVAQLIGEMNDLNIYCGNRGFIELATIKIDSLISDIIPQFNDCIKSIIDNGILGLINEKLAEYECQIEQANNIILTFDEMVECLCKFDDKYKIGFEIIAPLKNKMKHNSIAFSNDELSDIKRNIDNYPLKISDALKIIDNFNKKCKEFKAIINSIYYEFNDIKKKYDEISSDLNEY